MCRSVNCLLQRSHSQKCSMRLLVVWKPKIFPPSMRTRDLWHFGLEHFETIAAKVLRAMLLDVHMHAKVVHNRKLQVPMQLLKNLKDP